MPYEPTNWKSGDVVTSAKLNKLEQAVAGCSLVVHATTEDYVTTLDKTWQEIYDVFSAGGNVVIIIGETSAYSVLFVYSDGERYNVYTDNAYTTDSASGYPSYTDGDTEPVS